MYERALKGLEKVLGVTSISTYIPALNTLGEFGLLWERQGNAVNALLYYRRAVDSAETVFGRQSQWYARLSSHIGSLQCDVGKFPRNKHPFKR